MSAGGIVAAGHPLSAEAGARVLREGGNAVDAAIGALLTSFVCEPLLTGLGAGGYLMAGGFDGPPTLLDFFVAAPGEGSDGAVRADPVSVDVDFGDAVQAFNCGPATVGTWGMPAGVCAAMARWGSAPLGDLAAPAAALARDGVELNGPQGYISEILEGILTLTPECAEVFAPDGRALRPGDTFRWPDLGDALERLGAEGDAPFYHGDIADRIVRALESEGGVLTREDLAHYGAIARKPLHVSYRGRHVATNPPPNAGGILIAGALRLLDERLPDTTALADVMEAAQRARTREFTASLDAPGFAERFFASRLGSTTHVSVIDADGRACAVTTTNGEGCGIVVPGTGLHPNNIMGEEDLNPLGFHAFPPRRRMPSMMAPTMVLSGDEIELVLGSAGSNRIRSAILQVIAGVVDYGLDVRAAVEAPRLHFEDGVVFCEPGVDVEALTDAGRTVTEFRAPNLFFGGVQAVERDRRTGALSGAGDPRRGGAAVGA